MMQILKEGKADQWGSLVLGLEKIAKKKGLTQTEISARTGIKQSAISRFFACKYVPTLHTYTTIANAVGANIIIVEDDGEEKLV